MKKAFPVLWRYALVVMTSCALAFFISQNIAHAAEYSNAEITKPSIYGVAGPFVVQTLDLAWRDESRNRDIPIRVEFPSAESSAKKAFLLIVFSHGLGGSREGGVMWGRHWASHGFIAVHAQHVGSDETLWKGLKLREIIPNMKRAMSLENATARTADIKWMLDEITRQQHAGRAPFTNVDLGHIGMSEHSFGGQTTFAVIGQTNPLLPNMFGRDDRITAAIAFSPNARSKMALDKQYGSISLPVLSITGRNDGSILDDGTKLEDRWLPYQTMTGGNSGHKYLLSFVDGDHMVFGGHPITRRPEANRDRQIQAGVKASTLAFWKATLNDDSAAKKWLEQGDFKATLVFANVFEFK